MASRSELITVRFLLCRHMCDEEMLRIKSETQHIASRSELITVKFLLCRYMWDEEILRIRSEST